MTVTYPTITVEIAFANNPGDTTPTWVDVSAYVDGFRTSRGRQHELDRFETGTATILLDNNDRRFDPTYTAGPYYGQLLPMKRVRITATWDAVTYPVFSGLVEGWPQEYGEAGFTSYVPLPCADLFKSLALRGLNGSFPEETTGERVDHVLDVLGWPAGERSIDIGQSTVQAQVIDGTAALAHLQEVAVSENGFLFIRGDGSVRFIDRHQLILAPLDTGLTWGDDGAEFPYTGISLDYGDANLWNEVIISAPGLDDHVGTNGASQAKYFTRTYSRSSVLADEDQMQDLADFLASRYAEPAVRIVGLTTEENFAETLDREIGDKIRVYRRPQSIGSQLMQDSIIDGISLEVNATGVWRMSWNLSPTDSLTNYWVLGDATQSLLGSSTRLAY